MIFDNHVHVGWFTDGYHAPKEVWNSAKAAGFDGMAVASTSTCAELYKDVCREMRELKRLSGNRIYPLLWLTPRMMKVKYALPYMMHKGIRWQGVKFHFEAHPEWSRNFRLLSKGLDVARKLNVPVLFHTGNEDCCHAGLFKRIIEENKDLTFVLAHGRPINETIDVLRCCNNSYVDTAFMPMSDIELLVRSGLSERILFGTDAPINRVFFKDMSTSDYIRDQVKIFQEALGVDADRCLRRCIYCTTANNEH